MAIPSDIVQQCWFLAGPTACGKSDAGVELAERIGGEIISLDSMALYRGMDLGTAKPPEPLRRRVPHHLIDVLEPHEEHTVADYVDRAGRACREILDRGHVPLFVGGTGLYLRSLLRGICESPPADWELRRRLQQEAERHGPEFLHRELSRVDPDSAARLHPHDTRRLIRALEVFHTTGVPLSRQQREEPRPESERPRHVYWLRPPRPWLYERINRRVERMIEAGLIEEVRRLLSAPRPLSRTARQALGYKEVIDAFEQSGGQDLSAEQIAQVVELIQRRTRQFAKRQFTWFRNLVECRPVDITGEESPAEVAERLITIATSSRGR
ncbi:MAG TPA: tRNA (adenosine(37)-N6)-dimethylallyltransferase MiaA [Planctomycetaceae bacterium]|nr:tRNA (adenosine(37)-N6)-dimethylallyltransferase MiaA [Planctomycetaceae bacterium]